MPVDDTLWPVNTTAQLDMISKAKLGDWCVLFEMLHAYSPLAAPGALGPPRGGVSIPFSWSTIVAGLATISTGVQLKNQGSFATNNARAHLQT